MIDLKATFGDRYRITLDPSTQGEPRSDRVWYYRIPCKYGFISLHGPETLAAYARGRVMARKLERFPGVQLHQSGNDEARVLFPPDMLDQIAELIHARRRPRLSPEHRAKLSDRMKAIRKTPEKNAELDAPRDPGTPA